MRQTAWHKGVVLTPSWARVVALLLAAVLALSCAGLGSSPAFAASASSASAGAGSSGSAEPVAVAESAPSTTEADSAEATQPTEETAAPAEEAASEQGEGNSAAVEQSDESASAASEATESAANEPASEGSSGASEATASGSSGSTVGKASQESSSGAATSKSGASSSASAASASSGAASQSAAAADAGASAQQAKKVTTTASTISFNYLADPEKHGSGSWATSLFAKWQSGARLAISSLQGKLCLRAIIAFSSSDGTSSDKAAGDCDAKLRWEIVATYDENGNAASSPIAKLEKGRDYGNPEDCVVVALGTGNGSVVVRCISEAYPDLGYQDIVVDISGNAAAENPAQTQDAASAQASSKTVSARSASRSLNAKGAPTIVSACIVIKDAGTGEYQPIGISSGDDPQVYVALAGTDINVMVTYSDGTTKLASEAGLDITWQISNNVVGGKKVVDVTSANALSLTGVASKLVQVKALIDGAEVGGGPAYVNVVDSFSHQSDEKEIGSLLMLCSPSDDPSHLNYYSVAVAGFNVVPEITKRSGSLLLSAYVLFTGTDQIKYIEGSSAAADLLWQLVCFFDEDHDSTNTILAKASTDDEQRGTVKALGVGNGWAIVRCVSEAFPKFAGQEMLVRILGNAARNDDDVAARTLEGAKIVYYDKAVGKYVDYPQSTVGTTPTVITEPYGSVDFDVRLQFQDGSTALASDLGIAVDWKPGAMTHRNVEIAQLTPSGVLTALRAGNRNPNVTPTVMGVATAVKTAYVRITNNDTSIRPRSDGLIVSALANYWIGASQKPDDSSQRWYWRSSLVSGDSGHTVPLVTYGTGSPGAIVLQAAIRWTNTQTTVSEDVDQAKRTYSVTSSVDTNGAACAPLVSVSSDGRVYATGVGSGMTTIHVTTEVPYYTDDGSIAYDTLEADYQVAVYTNKKYVKSIVMLDENRKQLATSSIVLPSGKNVYQFYVQVTYVEYDDVTHSIAEKKVVVPWDTPIVEGLEWHVYRTDARTEKESYSQVSTTGSFLAQSGFSRGYVYASMKGRSYTGAEIGAGVTVIGEDSITFEGQTDSVTVKIYHMTDYMNHGDSAPVAKELVLTRDQLAAMATYSAWYTFQKRNYSFATAYAQGVSMRNLLLLCGVDPDLLISMAFTGTDGYFAERHSADYILGSQYRYTNYYYYKDLPGLVGSQTVAPMLALSYYMKNNAGYEDESARGGDAGSAGYGMMIGDSTLRIIFGMQGVGVRNANQSVSKVSLITIIVEDGAFPKDEEDPEDPEDPKEPEDGKGEEGKQGDEGDGESDKPGETDNPDPSDNDDDGKGDEGQGGDEEDSSTKPDADDGESGGSNPEDGGGDEGAGKGEGESTVDDGDGRKHGGAVAPTDGDTHDDSGDKDATGDNESMEGDAQGSNQDASERNQQADKVNEEGAAQGEAKDAQAQNDKQLSETDVNTKDKTEVVTGDHVVDHVGKLTARELIEQTRMVVPPAEVDRVWWVLVALGALIAFIGGALVCRRRYVLDRIDGKAIRTV